MTEDVDQGNICTCWRGLDPTPSIEDDATSPVFALKHPHPPWEEEEDALYGSQAYADAVAQLKREGIPATLSKSEGELIKRLEKFSALPLPPENLSGQAMCAEAVEVIRRLSAAHAKLVAEVERLSALKTPASKQLNNITSGMWSDAEGECESLRVENERLREALNHLWTMGIPKESVPMVRAALQSKGEQ